MATGDIWKLDVVTQQQGVNGVNVFFWEQIGDTNNPNGDTQSVFDAFVDDVIDPWVAWLSDRVTFLGIRIQKWVPKAILPTIIPFSAITGTIDADPIQSTKAALMATYTTEATARGRGRSFFMGVPETSVKNSQWRLFQHAIFTNFVNVFNGNIQADGDTALYKHGVFSSVDNVFRQETVTYARPTIYQQRSRQAEGL